MDLGRPDGEYFADEPVQTPIPPKNTWPDLTTSQLIDVKNQLEEKLWAFGNNSVIAKPLREGISQLEQMISSRALGS